MKYRLLAAAFTAAFFMAGAHAQNAGTVTNHAFAVGRGPGVTGFSSLLCASAQLAVGQSAADPICKTITGDVTITAAGVTAIGAAKVTNSMIAAMTSAQLAAIVSDETGSGALVFGTSPTFTTPALGTPASGVATNLTGTASGLTAGHVTTNANMTGDVTSVGNATTLATGNAGNLNSGTLLAARMPALTGDVTTSAGAVATTIAANAVTNAKAAQMAAFTVKGNATGSTANATDISIPALTQKASPVAADKVMIADSAASNALKYATVSSLASAGSVSSIAGNTGAFTLSHGITNSTNDIQINAGSVPGIATNTAASAGNVGEVILQQRLEASAVSLSNSIATDLTAVALPLTAGDWMIYGQCNYDGNSLVSSSIQCSISTSANVRPSPDQQGGFSIQSSTGISAGLLSMTPLHVLISTSTNYHLVGLVTFSGGSVVGYGTIYGVRLR